MSSTMQFRIDPLERELVRRAAAREGISASDLIRRSIRNEIGANPRGRLNLQINPRLATELLDKATRLNCDPEAIIEALLRDHLPRTDLFDIDPELRRARAKQRAKELLDARV